MTSEFGRPLRKLWGLAEDAIFLNHGSFGACPFEVLAVQDQLRREMEHQPDVFFRKRIMPGDTETPLRAVARALGGFLNTGAGNIAITESASAGTQAVLRSVRLGPGDRILVTSHGYNAVRLMVEAKCTETGALPLIVQLPIPATTDDVVERITAALTPAVKLAILDHITSPTALILPLERIIPALRANGTRVFIDGAHTIGQIPLNLAALDADWYVSNAHKWLYAPKGSAFLYAAPGVAGTVQPNVVSHYVAMGFPRSFDYMGTRDNTAWLAIPAALKFFCTLGPESIWAYKRKLVETLSTHMDALGAVPVGPIEMCAAMRSFVLPTRRGAQPGDQFEMMQKLWTEHRIQVAGGVLDGKLLLRVSTQAYVSKDDLQRMANALDHTGWPGR